MKLFLLVLFTVVFTVVFLTNAVEVTNEDINSPLVSYLLCQSTMTGGKDDGQAQCKEH